MSLIALRQRMNRRRKKFNRTEYNKYKKLQAGVWRKPKGKKSKMRRHVGGVRTVNQGFRNPASVRGLHYSGLPEVLVFNPDQLDGVKNAVIRIGGSVGRKKRLKIQEKAEKLKLRVVNKIEVATKLIKKGDVKNESKTTEKTSK